MVALVSIDLDGVGFVSAEAEYTRQEVADAYTTLLGPIITVFNKDPMLLDNVDVVIVSTSLQLLKSLAANGVELPSNPEDPSSPLRTFFLTNEMARSVDHISRTLSSVGFNENPTLTGLKRWRDLATVGLRDILQTSIDALDSNRSLQSLIELEYVKTGNQLLADNLQSLKEALDVTKSALETLNEIQDLHNKINVDLTGRNSAVDFFLGKFAGNSTPDYDDVEDYSRDYRIDADNAFKNALSPIVDDNPTTPTIEPISQATINRFNAIKVQLQREIAELDRIAGVPPSTRDPNSLAAKLQQVLDDMETPPSHPPGQPAIVRWILDNQSASSPDSESAGNIQKRLTEAITSGESLNDKQKEDLRRFMFLFEEYYKSASSLLSRITQIIEKMAQNIAR